MSDKLPPGEELLTKIRSYHAYIEGGKANEVKADEAIGELDTLVPHANISDLLFWSEKERSDEEVA